MCWLRFASLESLWVFFLALWSLGRHFLVFYSDIGQCCRKWPNLLARHLAFKHGSKFGSRTLSISLTASAWIYWLHGGLVAGISFLSVVYLLDGWCYEKDNTSFNDRNHSAWLNGPAGLKRFSCFGSPFIIGWKFCVWNVWTFVQWMISSMRVFNCKGFSFNTMWAITTCALVVSIVFYSFHFKACI